MADILSKRQRSALMSKIRSSHNKSTELKLIQLFREHSIKGWRRKFPLFGRPDFVFPDYSLCIFVDGCFWHGCPRCKKRSKSNTIFWENKIAQNKKRDRKVNRTLRSQGWSVCRIWECRLSQGELVIRRVLNMLHKKGLV